MKDVGTAGFARHEFVLSKEGTHGPLRFGVCTAHGQDAMQGD